MPKDLQGEVETILETNLFNVDLIITDTSKNAVML